MQLIKKLTGRVSYYRVKTVFKIDYEVTLLELKLIYRLGFKFKSVLNRTFVVPELYINTMHVSLERIYDLYHNIHTFKPMQVLA